MIAHSHGGNVALYALRAQPERLVDAIVCLATPYIVPKPRSIALYSRLAKLNAGMLLLMCVSFTASFVAAQFGYPLSVVMPWVRPLGLAWPYKALLLLVGIVFSFAVFPALVWIGESTTDPAIPKPFLPLVRYPGGCDGSG